MKRFKPTKIEHQFAKLTHPKPVKTYRTGLNETIKKPRH
jgi:hypothetical protein